MQHKHYQTIISTLFVLFFFFASTTSHAAKTVRIGILMDEKNPETQGFMLMLKKEARQLMGSEYNVLFPENKKFISEWSAKTAKKQYFRLVRDKSIDIIIIAGILSCSALTDQKVFKKPVIAIGIVDPVLQGIRPTPKNTSGIKNLTYILFNRSIERDLKLFHRVFPYKKVGIAANGELLKLLEKSTWQIKKIMKEQKTEFTLLPANNSIEDITRALGDVDAVYLEYLGPYEGTHRKQLIEMLNKRKLPTFGASMVDVNMGALAAAAPEESMQKVMRRIALNIEAALSGEKLSALPVGISFEEQLTINMETARTIGFSPGFEIMSQAELVNEFAHEKGTGYGLREVLDRALDASLDLAIKKNDIETAKKEISVARANYLPTLTASLGETIIDEKRAKLSGGSTAEQTANGKLTVEQLLFSEEQIGSVTSLKHQLDASEQAFNTAYLETGLNAATSYITAMKAKTAVKIRKENVAMTRTHLAIAKKKMAVGYAGKSDVYRLESNLATAQTDLLEAKNGYKKSKIDLNRIMNLPLSKEITLKETGLGTDFQAKYINRELKNYIENPDDLNRYTRFLVDEAFTNAPELKELEASEAAVKRRYKSLKRKRFLPVVSLGAESEHIFDRSGEGSDATGVDPPDDNWSAAVNLTWSLFSGGSVSSEIEKLRIELSTLKKQKLLLKQSIELNMRSAVLDSVSKVVNMKSSAVSADFASKSLELVRDAYAKGTASITELTDAQNTALNADLNRLTAKYDFIMAIITVERVAGSLSLIETTENINAHFNRVKALMENAQEEN